MTDAGKTDYRCRVKICGVTRSEDVAILCSAGADYIGFLVNINSPRSNTPEHAASLARKSTVNTVLLFQDSDFDTVLKTACEANPFAIQLHGDESPAAAKILDRNVGCEIWKAIHIPQAGESGAAPLDAVMDTIHEYVESGVAKILLDTVISSGNEKKTGGTGKTHDWNLAAEIVRLAPCPVIMAGGITPDNAVDAVKTVRPYALDLSSGVEKSKGVKDPDKVKLIISRIKSAKP